MGTTQQPNPEPMASGSGNLNRGVSGTLFGRQGTYLAQQETPIGGAMQKLFGSGAPPEQMAAAGAEAEASRQNVNAQTAANRPDQYGPFGFSGWQQDPTTGQWTQATGFSGPLAGANQSLQNQAAYNFGQPMDNGSAARDQAITGAYNQATSRLNPQWAQAGEQMDSKLANQGLDPNSAAARNAQQAFSFGKNDAYNSAMNSAIGQGTAAQQATFNQNMLAREAPLNEMNSMAQLLRQPSFNQAGLPEAPQYLAGAVGDTNYNLAQQQISENAVKDAANGITKMVGSIAGM